MKPVDWGPCMDKAQETVCFCSHSNWEGPLVVIYNMHSNYHMAALVYFSLEYRVLQGKEVGCTDQPPDSKWQTLCTIEYMTGTYTVYLKPDLALRTGTQTGGVNKMRLSVESDNLPSAFVAIVCGLAFLILACTQPLTLPSTTTSRASILAFIDLFICKRENCEIKTRAKYSRLKSI